MSAQGYKWELLRGGTKYPCPACGQKRFVPYVSAADHRTPADLTKYGRCDREKNCGFHAYPNGEQEPRVEPQPLPPPDKVVFDARVARPAVSPLYTHAVQLLGEQDARRVWHTYKIGATRDGRTAFWYIANGGEVRGAKLIQYKHDGHRDKEATPPVLWAHRCREFAGMFTGRDLVQPLYGEHLLAERQDAPVVVVESEKTAALMSAFFPAYVWISCGGSQGLKNAERLAPLFGRQVLLIPDNGQFYNWRRVANLYGWRITDYLEQSPAFEGCDVLDYIDNDKTLHFYKLLGL